ncbi:MAG: hypothetical protein ABI559_10435 [Chloroflexota bacterium]
MPTPLNCPNCGSQLPPNVAACARCGERFDPDPIPDAPELEPTPSAGRVEPAPAKEPQAARGPSFAAKEPPPVSGPTDLAAPPRPRAPREAMPSSIPPFEVWRSAMTRAFKLDEAVYTEVRQDAQMTIVAVATVVLATFLFAMGGWLMVTIEANGTFEAFWKSVIVGTLLGVGLWAAWVGLTRVVLAQMFHESVDLLELMRVHGLASAPLAIGAAMLIPMVSFGFALIGVVAWLLSTTFAIQSAFRLPMRSALLANVIGFAVWALVLPLLTTSNNPLGPGIFWFDWSKDVVFSLNNALSSITVGG